MQVVLRGGILGGVGRRGTDLFSHSLFVSDFGDVCRNERG